MEQHPDYRYLVALRENDSRLLNELYRDCAPKIQAWITKNNGTPADARDVFQDALLSLHKMAHRKDFQLTCPISALLFTICRNQWISRLRKQKKETEVREIEARRYEHESTVESAYERYEREELRNRRLAETMAQLSEKCRKLLRLLGRGATPQQAAEQLGMTNANTVYRRKNACLGRWRELLNEK